MSESPQPSAAAADDVSAADDVPARAIDAVGNPIVTEGTALEAAEPEAAQPETAQSEGTAPEAAEPETVEPEPLTPSDPRVADALSLLAEVQHLPLEEQVEVFADIHRRLAGVLADPDSQA